MKKTLVGLTTLLALATSAANADWYTVTVDMVGANNTTINLNVTDTKGAFSGIWVQARGTTSKEIIATGLTAKALNAEMLVQLDSIDDSVVKPEILGAYLK